MAQARRDVFQAIADPRRRKILTMISTESRNMNSIAKKFDISRPAISQHIKLLKECGLITMEKKGRQRICKLEPEKLSMVADWINQFRKLWESRFNQVDDVLKLMQSDKTDE